MTHEGAAGFTGSWIGTWTSEFPAGTKATVIVELSTGETVTTEYIHANGVVHANLLGQGFALPKETLTISGQVVSRKIEHVR